MKFAKRTRIHMIDRKIVEQLRLGKSLRAISRDLQTGFRRVKKVAELAKKSGFLDSERPLPAFPTALFDDAERLPLQPSEAELAILPHKEWVAERLATGWHKVTVYEELCSKIPIGRSSFYRFLSRHGLGISAPADRVVPEIVHRPGEALLLDWGHLCTVQCPETGKRRMVWAFVGVLGYSRILTVRLVWTNSVEVTMAAIEDMLLEFGGVPSRVTSDNPKCFALEASTFEPLLNPAFEMLASHYNFVVECLPPRDPEKKGKVERPMPFVRRLFEAHGEWRGLEEAQDYINKKIAIANERRHGTTGEKPSVRFRDEEKAALRDLPPLRFERQEIAEPVVRKDGHVRFKGKYYSVGEGLRNQTVLVLGTLRQVRIYHKCKLLCVHERILSRTESKSTKEEHKKSWERTFADNQYLTEQAARIGPAACSFVEIVLATQHGFVETRLVWGIIHLAGLYSVKDVDDACAIALETKCYSYRFVKGFLESTSTPVKKEEKRKHTFIRSMNEYTKHIGLKGTTNECNDSTGTTPQSEAINRVSRTTHDACGPQERDSNGLGGGLT